MTNRLHIKALCLPAAIECKCAHNGLSLSPDKTRALCQPIDIRNYQRSEYVGRGKETHYWLWVQNGGIAILVWPHRQVWQNAAIPATTAHTELHTTSVKWFIVYIRTSGRATHSKKKRGNARDQLRFASTYIKVARSASNCEIDDSGYIAIQWYCVVFQ
jgi:hypothetical protein